MTLESNGNTFPVGAGDEEALGKDVGAGVGGMG
jgi:hypothetical protein